MRLPRLYAILDAEATRAAGLTLRQAAESLHSAGVKLIQYRDKSSSQTEILGNAAMLRKVFASGETILILNDYPSMAAKAGFDGVHVGQGDGSVEEARSVLGEKGIVGVSTHTPEQVSEAMRTDADYIAYGPIFRTSTKPDAEAAVGLEGLRAVRGLTDRCLVAIGGIAEAQLRVVLDAGANSAAVIGALFGESGVQASAERLLRAAGE